MIKASFGLSETGSVRLDNQDSYLLDLEQGIFAVADGLGGLPNGARASKMTLEILRQKLMQQQGLSMESAVMEVNEETRVVGYQLDAAGFGSTLTIAHYFPSKQCLHLAHVGDSAAYLVKDGKATLVTQEHTVAARMIAEKWQDAADAIPLSAHHTLTQCIGQNLYIDPQIAEIDVLPGERFFLFTDGVTKPIPEGKITQIISSKQSLQEICQSLTFLAEAGGSPDNYTIVAVEF